MASLRPGHPGHPDLMDSQEMTELLDTQERTVLQDKHPLNEHNNTVDVKNALKLKPVLQERLDQKDCQEKLVNQDALLMVDLEARQVHQAQSVPPVMQEIQEPLVNQEKLAPFELFQERLAHQDQQEHQEKEVHQDLPEDQGRTESQVVKARQEILEPQDQVENRVAKDSQEHRETKEVEVNAITVHLHVPPLDINPEVGTSPSSLLSNLPFFLIYLSFLESTFASSNGSKLQKIQNKL